MTAEGRVATPAPGSGGAAPGVVGTLVRLRFQVLRNTLRRSPLQRIAVIAGAVGMLLLGAFGAWTGWTQGFNGLVLERQAPAVVLGSTIVLVWVIAPLVVGGAEPSLDPRKLARFPLRPGRVMLAELVVGLAWFPAAATLITALGLGLMWRNRPAAALTAVLASAFVVLTCVALSHAATALAANLVARRGAAGRTLATLIAGALLLVPTAAVILSNWPLRRHFRELVEQLAFTPLGAVWSLPGFVAEQEWGRFAAAAAVAAATIGIAMLLWAVALRRSLRTRGAAGARARGGRLGPFAIARPGPVGAIMARSLVLWFRDPRLVIQLVILPVVPALLIVLAVVQRLDWFAFVAAPLAAGLLPLAQWAGISYDGTAFASEVAAATPGRADRIGRAAAMLVIAAPITVLIAIVAPLAVGSPERVPAVLGLSLAALATGLGVASVSSSMVAVPVPGAGKNPFTAPPGSNATQVVGSYLVTAVAGGMLAPVLVLGGFALATGNPALGWATFAVGPVWGAGVLVGGVLLGGRMLDQSAPELLARLRRNRMR